MNVTAGQFRLDLVGEEFIGQLLETQRTIRAAATEPHDIFADGAGYRPMTEMAPSWSRLVRIRASDYLWTLWRALKGEDPYDDEGW